ncbi:MAG: DNA repair protein RadC [Myxococcota bacterium]|nr:DNA repair protein RadC [Myxococcota bacterium]
MASGDHSEVHIIREVAIRYVGRGKRVIGAIRAPGDVAEFMRRAVTDDAREHFTAIYLDGRHRPIALQIVSVGTATAALVHPREVFQPAVLLGACAVIVAHNHPSGDPSPSREDREVTKRLAEAGKLLGIALLDSIVWTREGSVASLRELSPELFS